MTTNLIEFPKAAEPDKKPLSDMGVLISTWLGLYAANSQMCGRDYADELLRGEIMAFAQAGMRHAN